MNVFFVIKLQHLCIYS